LRSFSGRSVWKKRRRATVGANSSAEIARVDTTVWEGVDTASHYLVARCTLDDGVVLQNRFFFEEPKHLRLPKAKVQARIARHKEGGIVALLKTSTFAKNVRLEAGGGKVIFEDNYFDMDARETKVVRILSRGSIGFLRKGFNVRTL
ncbi:MAG: Mannosidase Ig/CBM-like domain, partial [Bacteroidetes bacterium]|nr:Mannosidase Ig/CBM-like domain [Bacteroidota bacterium]